MSFTEYHSVERPLIQTLTKLGWQEKTAQEVDYRRGSYGEFFVPAVLKRKLLELNPELDEPAAAALIHKLKRIDDNEEFYQWLKGDRTYKPRTDAKALTIRLMDTEEWFKNEFWVTSQYTCTITRPEDDKKHIRPDVVLLVNGLPLSIIECKVLSTSGSTFSEGIKQLARYRRTCPELFVPNTFNISTDGHILKYGATGAPTKYYMEWKYDAGAPPDLIDDSEFRKFAEEHQEKYNPYIDRQVFSLLHPENYLDLIQNFIVFETRENITVKKIARYQQFRAVNKIVDRVLEGEMNSGLIWHTQGSGKSLTMLFTAWKLRKQQALNNPTILVVVDRIDLDDQISGTFEAVKMPNTTRAGSISALRKKLEQDTREVIITTIFKFQDIRKVLVERENVILLIDEAHRTQEGDNAAMMRRALPKAFFFGFTGTPIDRNDKNTHRNFGLKPDGTVERYMDLYNIRQSIEDGATVPVHYILRNRRWFLTDEAIDSVVDEAYSHLDPETLDHLKEKASRYETFMLQPERLQYIADDMAAHFSSSIEPRGFKAQLVCYSRLACVELKKRLDEIRGPDFSEVIFSSGPNDGPEMKVHHKTRDEIKQWVEKFKDPAHPVKVLIVQNMLLTGFDAPIEQVMYLDRPLKDHSLLQAIARTNRPYPNKKVGIIVDYCGILRNLNKALNFDESDIDKCLIDFDQLRQDLPEQIERFQELFAGVNKGNLSQCLKYIEDNGLSDKVKDRFRELQLTYDTLSPDPFVVDYQDDYAWATKLVLALRQLESQDKPDVSDFLPQTQALIQQKIDLKEVNETVPVFKIDSNYLSRLDGKALNKEMKELMLEHRIRSILRVKVGDLPVYKTLQERLEALIRRKNEETEDTVLLMEQLFKDTLKAKEEDEAGGESTGYRAIKQLLAPRISNNPELVEELAAKIDEKVRSEAGFKDWQLQDTVVGRIKTGLIIMLAQYAQQKRDLAIPPDDLSGFASELLTYIQKHY